MQLLFYYYNDYSTIITMNPCLPALAVQVFPDAAPHASCGAAPQHRASAEAVGFKCSNCDGIFDSRIAVAFHRCHVSCQGTACADSSSIQSLSFTGRADRSTGILRHHPGPGTLGAFYDCCALSNCYCRCFPVEIKRVSSL